MATAEQREYFKRIGEIGTEKRRQKTAADQERIDMEDKPYISGPKGCDCGRCQRARERGRRCK